MAFKKNLGWRQFGPILSLRNFSLTKCLGIVRVLHKKVRVQTTSVPVQVFVFIDEGSSSVAYRVIHTILKMEKILRLQKRCTVTIIGYGVIRRILKIYNNVRSQHCL